MPIDNIFATNYGKLKTIKCFILLILNYNSVFLYRKK